MKKEKRRSGVKTNLKKLNARFIVGSGVENFGTLQNSNNIKAKLDCTVYNSQGRKTAVVIFILNSIFLVLFIPFPYFLCAESRV